MSSLTLNLEDWDFHEQSSGDMVDDLSQPDEKAEYRYAGTTDFRGTVVFQILNDFLQPDTETSLETTVESILKIVPDAPLSDEVAMVGDIVLELAEQIPYHHPAQMKLARVMEGLMTSPKFMSGPYSSVSLESKKKMFFSRWLDEWTDGRHIGSVYARPALQRVATRCVRWFVATPTHPFPPLIMHITGPNTEFPRQWPNLMAFYAHLSSTHIVPHDPMYAIWTMREAFEERRAPTNPRFEGERDQWILAAAQFIL
jgi:hypothetical protein